MAIDPKTLDQASTDLAAAQKWWEAIVCAMPGQNQPLGLAYLLSGIYLKLTAMEAAANFGFNYFRITPVTLPADGTAQLLVDREPSGKLRKVSLWVDSDVGGIVPLMRVGTNANNYSANGIRINAGTVNEMGEVNPNTQLWGASNVVMNVLVIERA